MLNIARSRPDTVARITSHAVEVAGIVTLVQLPGGFTKCAIDHATALGGWPLGNLVRPAQHIRIGLNLQELARFVQLTLDQGSIPGPNRHVGDGVLISGQVGTLR